MIVSSSHRFIFVHIPKNAGTSIRNALMPLAGANELASSGTKHEDLPAFFERHGRRFDDYFKFAIVRSPWDRMVSFYFFLRQQMGDRIPEIQSVESVPDFLRELEKEPEWLRHRHSIRRQTEFITEGGALLVDLVGRYEQLPQAFAAISERLGLEAPLLEQNRSEHAHFAQYYDDWSRDFVARRYASDIEAFGYEFPRA